MKKEKRKVSISEEKRKGKQVNLFVKKSDIRRALVVLMYKEASFSANELNPSLPSVIISLLQEFEDVLPEVILNSYHQ